MLSLILYIKDDINHHTIYYLYINHIFKLSREYQENLHLTPSFIYKICILNESIYEYVVYQLHPHSETHLTISYCALIFHICIW